MTPTAPLDPAQAEIARPVREPASPVPPRTSAEADAFGELGPILAAAFLLWVLISTAVALSV